MHLCMSVHTWDPVSTGSCCYRCWLSAATHYHSKQVTVRVCVRMYLCECERKAETDNTPDIYSHGCVFAQAKMCVGVSACSQCTY